MRDFENLIMFWIVPLSIISIIMLAQPPEPSDSYRYSLSWLDPTLLKTE
jgi:hypothetical protein